MRFTLSPDSPTPIDRPERTDPTGPSGRTVHRTDSDGTVRDWFVSPVLARPVTELDALLDAHGSPWPQDAGPRARWVLTNGPDVNNVKSALHERSPLVTDQQPPTVHASASFDWRTPAGVHRLRWQRHHVPDDGLVDVSAFCFTPEHREVLAATVLEVDQAEWRVLEVSSTGPVACWVGGRLVLAATEFSYMEPLAHTVRVRVPSGTTEVVVAAWQVAFRECRHVVRLRVQGLPVRVVLPDQAADEHRSAVAEQVLDGVGLRRWASPNAAADLVGPVGASVVVDVTTPEGDQVRHHVRFDPDGRASVPLRSPHPGANNEGEVTGETEGEVASASMLVTGETVLRLGFDDPSLPVLRELRVACLPAEARSTATGDPGTWTDEVLAHVADSGRGTAAVLARHVRGGAAPVRTQDLEEALDRILSRGDCADFEVLGLLLLLNRTGPDAWTPDARKALRGALTGMKYWIDQPGLDAMCYFTENHQMVWHTGQRLAGLTFADAVFTNDGRTGAQHAAEGGARAQAWMRRKLDGGFSEFDSNAYLAIDALALVCLVELDEDPDVAATAEALLDKTLLTLASNSWRGAHTSAHGRTYVPTLRSSRFEETAPVLWWLAGVGALNSAVLPVTALATARRYTPPALLGAVAADHGEQWWGRQAYRGSYAFERDLLSRPYGSDLRVWSTRHAVLSSVQDYRSGLPGLQEHIWGAAVGPEVQVTVTHPANSDSGASARPNAWAGQRVLPRVRQHKDVLLVRYEIAADDPFQRTHLWFPVDACDEWTQNGSWLAGRSGDGYVAVATPGGVWPVVTGSTAWQEWLPAGAIVAGAGRSWVATVSDSGSGPLEQWVRSLAEPETFGDVLVWRTPSSTRHELGLRTPFLLDGEAVDLDPDGLPATPPHLDNPAVRQDFGDDWLHARWGGHELVLDLVSGRRLVPEGAERVR